MKLLKHTLGAALGAIIGAFFLFFFSPENAKILIENQIKKITKNKSVDSDNRLYKVFIQYYPSTKQNAECIKEILEKINFSVMHFQELSKGSLSPKTSEILFYSEQSHKKSNEINNLLRRKMSLEIPVLKSKYYGDKNSVYKLFINVLD